MSGGAGSRGQVVGGASRGCGGYGCGSKRETCKGEWKGVSDTHSLCVLPLTSELSHEWLPACPPAASLPTPLVQGVLPRP